MAKITHVMQYGDQIGVHFDTGLVVMAVPTDIQGLYLTSSTGGGVVPGDGTFIWPFPESAVSSPYGPRDEDRFHEGIDFGGGAVGGTGTPIPAIGDGIVQTNEWHNAFGNMLILDHGILPAGSPFPGERCRSLYAHMDFRPAHDPGDSIAKGATVGPLGDTGSASQGAHLHLEIHIGANIVWNTSDNGGYRSAVDPKPFLDAYL